MKHLSTLDLNTEWVSLKHGLDSERIRDRTAFSSESHIEIEVEMP
jgi:hypothetical protein